jgi:predicted flavoprotein YhiN
LSSEVREGLRTQGKAELVIDLKPELTKEECVNELTNKGNASIKDVLEKKIKLSDAALQLIKGSTSKEEYQSPHILSERIKNFKIIITGLAPIDEAISTVGGIPFDELTSELELKKLPDHYCMGEMIDWDAPTGGYLLQMCYSMGSYLASCLNKKF